MEKTKNGKVKMQLLWVGLSELSKFRLCHYMLCLVPRSCAFVACSTKFVYAATHIT